LVKENQNGISLQKRQIFAVRPLKPCIIAASRYNEENLHVTFYDFNFTVFFRLAIHLCPQLMPPSNDSLHISYSKPAQSNSDDDSKMVISNSSGEPKSSAHYQREFRKRLREQGLVKKEAWILPVNGKLLSLVEKELRVPIEPSSKVTPAISAGKLVGDAVLAHNPPSWTVRTLYEALLSCDLTTLERASLTLLDDGDTLEIVMHELGDLPLLLTIAGQQMLVEAVLWDANDVSDVAAFDAAVLRTHKYFPLSTIGIETFSNGHDYYTVFGALSTNSLLANVVLEIETLGVNVIQAVSAYSPFLKESAKDPLHFDDSEPV
jgi:uncharacterized protein YjfI (DUF2170 family)